MLENLISLVKEHAGEAVINNPSIPNEQNEAVIAEAARSIESGLQNMMSGGKLQELLSLFHIGSGNNLANPAVQNISSDFIQNLVKKFGVNQGAANNIASSLIPQVMQHLASKTNDPADDSFSLEGIINHLTKGKNLNGLLGNLTESNVAEGLMAKAKGLFGS